MRTQLEVRNFVHAEMVPEENGGASGSVPAVDFKIAAW